MGEPGAGQGGTCQVCTSRFGTVQARIVQVKTSQAHQVRTGQVSAGQNGQILLGTRVWPYSVLLVINNCQ